MARTRSLLSYYNSFTTMQKKLMKSGKFYSIEVSVMNLKSFDGSTSKTLSIYVHDHRPVDKETSILFMGTLFAGKGWAEKNKKVYNEVEDIVNSIM